MSNTALDYDSQQTAGDAAAETAGHLSSVTDVAGDQADLNCRGNREAGSLKLPRRLLHQTSLQSNVPSYIDAFRPHPLLRSGHLQTIFGALVTGPLPSYSAMRHLVRLSDGEAMVVHEEQPRQLPANAPLAILVHGLGGDHRSPYLRRIAERLSLEGMRVWRVDLRGCGDGLPHAYRPAHAGSSADLAAVVATAQERYPDAPISIAAFSLGGNILLKMLGELAETPRRFNLCPERIVRALAIAPPADLQGCCMNMERWSRLPYTRYYLKMLGRQVQSRAERWEPWRSIQPRAALKTIRQFDHWYTAPLAGFSDTHEYYRLSSSARWLAKIDVPTRLLLDTHDPIIPIAAFESLALSPHIELEVTRYGGHLGYLAHSSRSAHSSCSAHSSRSAYSSRRRLRRWMDDWVVQGLKAGAQ